MKALFTLGFAAIVCACSGAVHAQAPAYPAKPVRIVVGFAAGGGTDVAARIVAQKLSESQTVRAMNLPDVKDKMTAQGLFVTTGTAEEFSAYLKAEIAKWATVVKESGARAE